MDKHVHFFEIFIKDGIFVCKVGFESKPPWKERIVQLFNELDAIVDEDIKVQKRYIKHCNKKFKYPSFKIKKYDPMNEKYFNALQNMETLIELQNTLSNVYIYQYIPKYISVEVHQNRDVYWNYWGTLLQRYSELYSLITEHTQTPNSKRKLDRVFDLINSLSLQPLE